MKKIILDTSFIMALADWKIDLSSEMKRVCDFRYEIYILDKTIDELNNIIKKQKGKNKLKAQLAFKLIEGKVKVMKKDGNDVDSILINLASKDNLVATQDKEIKKKIKGKVITIRQKKYFYFE